MGVFIGVVLACTCGAIGFFMGSTWTLDAIKEGRFYSEGFSYSYFDNVSKRRRMGRA